MSKLPHLEVGLGLSGVGELSVAPRPHVARVISAEVALDVLTCTNWPQHCKHPPAMSTNLFQFENSAHHVCGVGWFRAEKCANNDGEVKSTFPQVCSPFFMSSRVKLATAALAGSHAPDPTPEEWPILNFEFIWPCHRIVIQIGSASPHPRAL